MGGYRRRGRGSFGMNLGRVFGVTFMALNSADVPTHSLLWRPIVTNGDIVT